MKRTLTLFAISLLFVSSAAYAQWTTIYQSGFESPTYTADQLTTAIATPGQDNWMVDANPTNSMVVSDGMGTGNQVLALINSGNCNTFRALSHAYTTGHIRLTFDWVMTATGTNSGITDQNMWAIINDSMNNGSNRLGSLNSTYKDGVGTFYALTYDSATKTTPWLPFGSFSMNEVHTLAMDFNLDTLTYDVYMDGNLELSSIYKASAGTSKTASYIHFRKRYNTGNFSIDNVKVEVTPEPSSMLALICGSIGIVGMITRKKK
jgi:hypothetical protein